ncbi:MAG: hypothetical protein HYU59_06770 [Magnetospirillum gryphiswaldense]|nr:hypothetical protein [Magnetospirillum gryphiswaldense]
MIPAAWRRLEALLDDPTIQALSVDVYDTLLMRGTRPEILRFGDIAAAQDRALRSRGMTSPGQAALWRQRVEARAQLYAAANAGGPEVCHTALLAELARRCHLPAAALSPLRQAELAYERGVVRPNHALADRIVRWAKDRPVTLLSDMYLEQADLAAILAHHLPQLAAVPLVVSSTAGASKRRGDLFGHLTAHLGVAPSAVLHVGDDVFSDGEQARRAGLRVMILPRRWSWRMLARWRKAAALRRLQKGLLFNF